jgi:ABC-type sugar transport system ATPase subunit
MVLVGPSGSGKTTALRMVAGLEEISEDVVLIGDRVVNQVASRDRDIAMVFQSYALYPHLNVYDNIAFGLRLRKLKKNEIDRRVKEVARILGVEQLLKRALHCSTGSTFNVSDDASTHMRARSRARGLRAARCGGVGSPGTRRASRVG